jgi:hypothetical protein
LTVCPAYIKYVPGHIYVYAEYSKLR